MAAQDDKHPGLRGDLLGDHAPTQALRRLLDAVEEQRHALAGLIREHEGLHSENLQLVEQLLELPDSAAEDLSEPEDHCVSREESVMASVRYKLLRSENEELAESYQKVLEENNNLFKLYIASHRLHSSLALEEVLDVISEIVLNLIGAEGYAIYSFDQDEQVLSPVIVRGVEDASLGPVAPGEGPIGRAMDSRQSYTVNPGDTEEPSVDDLPMVVIPLRTREQLVGAIAVYRLFSHKPGLRSVDYQLFDYLATHASMALHSASLYAKSERKVSKMKEFLTFMDNPGKAPGVGSEDC